MNDEANILDEPESVLGTVRIKLSGKVKTDTWTDYESTWGCSENSTIDITSVSHFGWCLGVEVAALAASLIQDHTSNGDEALRGLAESLKNAADEILEAVEESKDL